MRIKPREIQAYFFEPHELITSKKKNDMSSFGMQICVGQIPRRYFLKHSYTLLTHLKILFKLDHTRVVNPLKSIIYVCTHIYSLCVLYTFVYCHHNKTVSKRKKLQLIFLFFLKDNCTKSNNLVFKFHLFSLPRK